MSVSRPVLLPGAGAQVARALLLLPVRLMQTQLGRRAVLAGALVLLLQGVVGTMYDNAEVPAVTGPRAVAAAASRPAPSPAVKPAKRPTKQAATRASTPEDAAVAWYARRLKLDRDRVRPLQRQAAKGGRVKVLVMADAGAKRLSTAVVTVRRSGSGWAVT
jgi:hypothetical protein